MYGGPNRPGQHAADTNSAALEDPETLSDHRHVAFVKVAKRARCGSAGYAPPNQGTGVTTLLHCHLRHAWQGHSILVQRCRVADDENLGVRWHSEVVFDAHSPGTVSLHIQPLACGGRRNTRRPDHRFTQYPFARYDDAVLVDLIHAAIQPDLHAQVLKLLLCRSGKII